MTILSRPSQRQKPAPGYIPSLLLRKTRPEPQRVGRRKILTVRFLVTSTGTWTTKLLGLSTSVISDKKGSVELDESLLELVLGVLVDEFLVVGD